MIPKYCANRFKIYHSIKYLKVQSNLHRFILSETSLAQSSRVHNMSLIQKQPPRGVPRKRCSENMQRIYRRTLMPKCDFNKVALQLY